MTDAVPNPDENQPMSDEWSVTFERELARAWAFRTTGIYAKNFNLRRTEEIYRPYSVYNTPITVRDPGNDGLAGNADDPGTTVTYYGFPTSLSGRQFAGTMLVNVPGRKPTRPSKSRGPGGCPEVGRLTSPSRPRASMRPSLIVSL